MSKFRTFLSSIFEYYTPKIVLIKNKKVGALNRFVQLAIISYIIGYAIIWNKGYQDFSTLESSVTAKVKGIAFTNFSDDEFNDIVPDKDVYRRIWDVADYVVPASENNAFFVVTNIVITSHQTQGKCPEDPDIREALCQTDSDCIEGSYFTAGNGVLTGKCVTSDINATLHVCQIYGWCPVEKDVNPLKNGTALLTATKKFTVLIKNFVDFPKYKVRRRNIPDFSGDSLKGCTYHPVNNPLCPIFVLEDIVPGDYDKMAQKGAAIAIIINWDCNLDHSAECFPTYSFRRLDENSPIAPGLNFRYADYYSDSARTLHKVYGLKFIIMAQGRAGKFSVVPLMLNIGSGLGLLAVATIFCDVVVLYLLKKRDFYKSVKYQSVRDESISNNGATKGIEGSYGADSEISHLKSVK